MTEDLLVKEFIDTIRERADQHYKGKLEQAFVDWYVEAEFGRVRWDFTDDAGDGGIDAVIWRPDERPSVIILQSKFSERVGGRLLGNEAYRDFDRVVEAFRQGGVAFDEFLGAVKKDEARRVYRRAQGRLEGDGSWAFRKQAFRLITTCRARPNQHCDRVPESTYWYDTEILRLYQEFRKGHTPRANDLCLGVDGKLPYRDAKRGGATSYLFNARVSDFRRYLENNDVARLVARNIRYNLSGRIGREIRATYERNPQDFWYVHNGITIICDRFSETDETATLENPSVVNGAQTLYAIEASSRKNSPALVATRVVVRGSHRTLSQEDDDWVQTVIRGVNTQNRVRNQDFRSNEPEQIELQHLFRDQKVFYERKRGEWREHRNNSHYKGFGRTSLRNVGMILTAVSKDDGSGVVLVKRGVETIFDQKNYAKLFPSRARIGHRFERIYLAYRAAEFVRRCPYPNRRDARMRRHAFWTTVWLFHMGLLANDRFHTRATVASIRDGFDRLEGATMVGRSARKRLKALRAAVWSAWRRARRADPERWTASNFFKSRWGHRRVLQLAFPKHRKAVARIGLELLG